MENTMNYPAWFVKAENIEQALELFFEVHYKRFADRNFKLWIEETHEPNIDKYKVKAMELKKEAEIKEKKEAEIKEKQEEITKLEKQLAELRREK
jgi:predicted RNase H-like nuclease (RuvC/YqgF family)